MKKILPFAVAFILGGVVTFLYFRNYIFPEHATRVESTTAFLNLSSNTMWIEHDINMINLLSDPTEKNVALTRQFILLRLVGRKELFDKLVSGGKIPQDILEGSQKTYSDLDQFIVENKSEIEKKFDLHRPQQEEAYGERRIILRRD